MIKLYITFGQKYRREEHPHWAPAHPDGWLTISVAGAPVESIAEDAARAWLQDNLRGHYAFLYREHEFSQADRVAYYPMGEIAEVVIGVPG